MSHLLDNKVWADIEDNRTIEFYFPFLEKFEEVTILCHTPAVHLLSPIQAIKFYLFTESRCLHIFLFLKFQFYFYSPFFSVDPYHVVNSLLSHSCYHFLHPRISRSPFFFFFFFFFLVDIILKFFEVVFRHPFVECGRTSSTVCLFVI